MKFLTSTSCQFLCHCPLTFHHCPDWKYCLGSQASSERVASRSGVSLQALPWSAFPMGAVHYFLESFYNRCYEADKQAHTPRAQSVLRQARTHLPIPKGGERLGWWRECVLRGERCSEVLLMSLCGHAVFSACHHGWDSAACLLLRMHWHFSGAYPRILLSGRRLNEALPGDRGRKLHHPSGALLCAGCHPNCYCKYRIDFFVTVRSEITFPVFLFSFFLPSWAFTSSLTGVSCSSQSLEWNSAFKKKKKKPSLK